MAKVSAPVVPVELTDGTKLTLSMEEATELRDQLTAILPPVFVPMKIHDVGATLQMPPEEDATG